MAPSEGCGGDPAAGEGSTRSSRSGRMGMRYLGDRPAVGRRPGGGGGCDADGVEEEAVARRGCCPNGPTPAAGERGSRWLGKRVVPEETTGKGAPAVPRCGLCRQPARRRPLQFGEGTSAAGAEERCAQMGPAASFVPVPSGGRGGRGGRGDRDDYIYGCTSRLRAFSLSSTSDLRPKDQATPRIECMEEAYLAKNVHADVEKEIKVGEVIRLTVEEERDLDKSKDYKPSAADAPDAPSESKATQEPPKAKNEVQVSGVEGTGPDGSILKADIEDYLAKGGKSESFAASGLDYTDIPNAQIRKVTADRLLASKQTIPHYYLTVDTHVDKLIKLRGELNPLQEASGGKKISINDLVMKGSVARWLKKEGDKVSLGGILCGAKTEKVTAEMKVMEEGYLAKIVQGDGTKEIKVEEHVLSVKKDINGENEISWEKEASEPSDFVCSDRGGCFGSKKGKLNYISRMNYYLRADCVSDIKPISDIEARSCHARYEVLKERCCDLAEIPALLSTCGSIKISGVDIVTQIFMDICGSTISIQENLSKLDINLLSEVAFVKSGIKPRDFYSTYAGKVLEPNRLLSCYQIPRDSTIKLNTRLRGGWFLVYLKIIDFVCYETWDDIIRAQQLYETVLLPPQDLVLPRPGGSAMQGTVPVKYLAEHMQFRSRKVLIQLCRKHYCGISYGGNITSKNILFDPDGNVHISSATETFSEHSAKSDYVAIGTVLEDSFKDHAKNFYPMHLHQLVDFLRHGPVVDYKSEGVIAFVTNHPSLLSHFERIQISESLVQLIDRLDPAVVTVLLASLDQFVWGQTVKKVPAMKHTYVFHSWRNRAGKLCVPYKENGVSFLKFSNNFFKHHDWASLEQLDAAFSLVMEIKNFIPRCLFTILVTLKNSQSQYAAQIQSFIDQVVRMLGNNVIDLKSRVMPV